MELSAASESSIASFDEDVKILLGELRRPRIDTDALSNAREGFRRYVVAVMTVDDYAFLDSAASRLADVAEIAGGKSRSVPAAEFAGYCAALAEVANEMSRDHDLDAFELAGRVSHMGKMLRFLGSQKHLVSSTDLARQLSVPRSAISSLGPKAVAYGLANVTESGRYRLYRLSKKGRAFLEYYQQSSSLGAPRPERSRTPQKAQRGKGANSRFIKSVRGKSGRQTKASA